MSQKHYTTMEAAERLGITRQCLYLWISENKIIAPRPITLGGRTMRLWSAADISRARTFRDIPKVEHKRKGKK